MSLEDLEIILSDESQSLYTLAMYDWRVANRR